MVSEWRQHPLGHVAEFINGDRGKNYPSQSDRVAVGIPFVNAGDLVNGHVDYDGAEKITNHAFDRLSQGKTRPGDILFCLRGSPGRVGRDIRGTVAIASSLVIIRARELVDAEFLYFMLSGPAFQNDCGTLNNGSAQPNVSVRSLSSLDVSIPPLAEQRAIAGVLGALDDKIVQNRQTARALERLARAIFRAWFVDFEPVKAKAAGATAFPSMPQAVFDALPTRFVDSDIGPVPEGWGAGAISNLATITKTQVNPQENPDEVVDHFSIPAFDAGMRPVVEAGSAIKSNKFLVVDGCVLLSKLNPRIARVWLPPMPRGRKQIASTEFLVFVPSKTSDRHYLYCQFQQTAFREELAQGASGTSHSHQRVRPDDVLNRLVVVPPPPTREAFAGIAKPMFALTATSHEESAKLAQMRDYLLPKLLTGDLRVAVAHGTGGESA